MLRVLFAMVLGSVMAIPTGLHLLYSLIRHPIKTCSSRKRKYPAVLEDPDLEHRYFTLANGLKMHALVRGNPSAPLVLCLHGFPEFSFSWKEQLKTLSDEFFVVAPDQRGYGLTAKPSTSWWTSGRYSMDFLMQDVAQLLEALERKSCVLVGHDWGANVAWNFAAHYPEMVEKLVILNVPHPKGFLKNMSFAQFKKSWYIFFFQVPVLPELMMMAGDYRAIKLMLTGRKMGTQVHKVTDEELDAYQWNFSQPGVTTAAINWYRAMFKASKKRLPNINAPTLVLWGVKDQALGVELLEGTEKWVPNITVRRFEDASHWLQLDKPAEVSAAIRDFAKSVTTA